MNSRTACTVFRLAVAFGCSFGAFVLFFGGDADFARWSFVRRFFGVEQNVSWTFPVLFSLGFAALSYTSIFLLGRLPRYRDEHGLLLLESLILGNAAAGIVAVAAFIAVRPPNYAITIVVTGLIFLFLIDFLWWAFRARHKALNWHDEAKKARVLTNISLVVAGIMVSILLVEAALRVHNPFALRIKGNQIVLQNNYTFVIENGTPGKLEKQIVHHRNAIGLRGEDPPPDIENRLSVVAVGGSTTEDYYLSDDKTWTAVLGRALVGHYPSLWINNAGLAGHSTSAHQLLITDYVAQLKPNIVLFYIGINDLIKDGLGKGNIKGLEESVLRANNNVRPLMDRLADISELANLAFIIYRRYQAAASGAAPFSVNLRGEIKTDEIVAPQPGEADRLLSEMPGALDRYKKRVIKLIKETRDFGARPVLMTQPLLLGPGHDPDEGFRLDNLAQTLLGRKVSSLAYWQLQEHYNDVLRELKDEAKVPVIDVARLLEKRSRYFIDTMHYSVDGANAIGEIVAYELCPWIEEMFPGHRPETPCRKH